MRKAIALKVATLVVLILCMLPTVWAQTQRVTGKVTDQSGNGVAGVTITVRGTNTSTQTSNDGTYSISAPANATLVFSSVGYAAGEEKVGSRSTIDVALQTSTNNLSEVVVIGYGTARRRDITGAVGSVSAKDFNKGQINSPEQLLQGKVAGLQITNSSGQPGGITIVKIRGNNSIRSGNSPLYVVDGVPLDGRTPRPGFSAAGVGTTPGGDPLTFINASDIAEVQVLKDASASAIYGSRGANGVILISTKKGISGTTRVDFNANAGYGNIMRKIKVLDAAGYRTAIKQFSAPNTDSGANVDPFGAITRSAFTQNYNVSISGGSENGRFRASFFHGDQDGIIRKTNLKKDVASFNGSLRLLDKKLSVDFNTIVANVREQIAPISQDAGSGGNLISLALIWNPTLSLTRPNGTYNQANPSGQVNPLALSEAYNDYANTTTILSSVSAGYKFTPWLEYRFLGGINYGTSDRTSEIQGWIAATGGIADGKGIANIATNKLTSYILTHTLNFTKDLTSKLNLNATVGYEYYTTKYKGSGTFDYDFSYNLTQQSRTDIHYYDNIQSGKPANLSAYAFYEPYVGIQSYFGRAILNYNDKYIVTATYRADGSSKFGANNKYAYFPSVAAAWNITNEDFMKSMTTFNSLKLRVGYGETGNQEFGADASLQPVTFGGYQSSGSPHYASPNLKWETVKSVDAGIDFAILKGKVYGSVDYFNKKTNDPVFLVVVSQPTAGGTLFQNLAGASLSNKGVEITLGADIVTGKDFNWSVNGNLTFVKNKFTFPPAGTTPLAFTGALNGQGTSGAYSEAIANNQPVDVFYIPQFQGFDKNGIGIYSTGSVYAGDPNPSAFLGFSTDLNYKHFGLNIGAHGSFGNMIYNNTAMSVLNIANINGGRNIASDVLTAGENPANAITPSTRFLEKGDYLKLGNATLKYTFGNVGRAFKNLNIYVSGNNLFVISKYKGFDPEVNVDKALNGIPSLGVDYIGYPTQRTIIFGVNFSL